MAREVLQKSHFHIFQFLYVFGTILASKRLHFGIKIAPKIDTEKQHMFEAFWTPDGTRTGGNNGGLQALLPAPGEDTGGGTPPGGMAPQPMTPGKQGSADDGKRSDTQCPRRPLYSCEKPGGV